MPVVKAWMVWLLLTDWAVVQGFVGGLGVEDNGEPMKLRTNALVRDKSSVPAAFDVKGDCLLTMTVSWCTSYQCSSAL